jgi:hypothetical protein
MPSKNQRQFKEKGNKYLEKNQTASCVMIRIKCLDQEIEKRNRTGKEEKDE